MLVIAMGAMSCARERAADAPPAEPEPHPQAEPETSERPAPSSMREVSPGLWLDAERGVVEFAGRISPMIAGGVHGRSRFLLEQFVCLAGTKDHESLVVTDVQPSAIHAALLAAGAEPGRPATWVTEGQLIRMVAPTGAAVRVEFVASDGSLIDPRAWVADAETGAPMPRGEGGWVFAGSTIKSSRGSEFYEADAAGTIVGLAGFGSETIAWTEAISDQEEAGELRWVAGEYPMAHPEEPVRVRVLTIR